jgi:hypothetical protein
MTPVPTPKEVDYESSVTLVDTGDKMDDIEVEHQEKKGLFSRLVDFYFKNEFLIMILLAVALAKAYPPLGADYLKPKITATWVAVVIIFGTLV